MFTRTGVDSIYIATPTVAKEEIALAAIAADKHVMIEKPFIGHASVLRMTKVAEARRLVFMDAIHFVDDPA